jgi:hypothetical protein
MEKQSMPETKQNQRVHQRVWDGKTPEIIVHVSGGLITDVDVRGRLEQKINVCVWDHDEGGSRDDDEVQYDEHDGAYVEEVFAQDIFETEGQE